MGSMTQRSSMEFFDGDYSAIVEAQENFAQLCKDTDAMSAYTRYVLLPHRHYDLPLPPIAVRMSVNVIDSQHHYHNQPPTSQWHLDTAATIGNHQS
jgi:hypothetical protein